MKEPSVIIQMSADSIPSNTTAGQNIASGVIIAECGTLKPKVFNSSTEVLREFTKSGALTRKSDITLIHAAAIADIMPVFLKRSYDDDGTRAGFGIYKSKISESTEYKSDFSSVVGPIKYGVKYPVVNSSNVKIADVSIDSGYADILDHGVLSGQIFNFFPTSKYNTIELTSNGFSYFSYAYITNNLGEETYIERDKIVIDLENETLTIDCGDRTSSDYVTVVFTSDIKLFTLSYTINSYVTYKELFVKNEVPLEYKQELIFGYMSDPEEEEEEPVFVSAAPDPLSFKIVAAGCLFYNETQETPENPDGLDVISIGGLDRRSTVRDIIDAINKQLKTSYIDFDGSNYTLYSEEELDSSAAYTGTYDNTIGEAESVLDANGNGLSLLIYSNYPSSVDFTAKVNPNVEDPDLIDIVVVTATRSYEYSGSIDPEYVNAYGANQFIENINEYDGIPFTVKVLDIEVPAKDILTTPTVAFGKMNIGTGAGLSTRRAALEELVDQDEVSIAFLCPLGYVNNSYLIKMASYPTKIWAFNPIGLYMYKDDPEALIANKPAILSEYSLFMAPHDRSTSMTDWVVDMTLEVSYLQKIMSNSAKGCEFAPMMGKENASLQITKPSVVLKKSSREKLLDARIMSLVTRTSEGVNYLNKNKCSGGDTVLSEEQNARLACKINRDLDVLLEPIIGRYNTEETRSKVETTINNYFTQNITNQVFSIESFEVICNEDNNPRQIRANNQLVVDLKVTYLNAIYDVLVYHRALNVASNNE